MERWRSNGKRSDFVRELERRLGDRATAETALDALLDIVMDQEAQRQLVTIEIPRTLKRVSQTGGARYGTRAEKRGGFKQAVLVLEIRSRSIKESGYDGPDSRTTSAKKAWAAQVKKARVAKKAAAPMKAATDSPPLLLGAPPGPRVIPPRPRRPAEKAAGV